MYLIEELLLGVTEHQLLFIPTLLLRHVCLADQQAVTALAARLVGLLGLCYFLSGIGGTMAPALRGFPFTKATLTLQASLSISNIMLRSDLLILMVHIHKYQRTVSSCNVTVSVLKICVLEI